MTAGIAWQAGAVAIGGRGVLIEGPPGSGKSSLALALVDRGAMLVGDDGVMFEPDGGQLLVSPHPAITGQIEVRNVGLVTLPTASRVPVSILLVLDRDAPRHIDAPELVMRAGIELPLVRLYPESTALALRAEAALRIYGRARGLAGQ